MTDEINPYAEPSTESLPVEVDESESVVESVEVTTPEVDWRNCGIDDLRKHMNKVEKEHDGISNVPVNHEYYKMRERLQILESKE